MYTRFVTVSITTIKITVFLDMTRHDGYKFIKASKKPAALFFRVAVILLLVIILYPCGWRGRGRPIGKTVKKLGLFTRSRTTNYPIVMFAERYSCSLYVFSTKAIVL